MFKVNDTVKLSPGAIYNNGKEVAQDVLNLKLVVRAVKDNCYTVARAKTGPVLGDVDALYLIDANTNSANVNTYVVYLPEHDFPLYHSPSKNSGVIRRVKRGLYTIVDEKNGFGKIKIGTGWVELSKVKVM